MPRIQHYEANPSATQIAGAGGLLSGQALETGTPPINEYFAVTASGANTSITLGVGSLRLSPLWIPVDMTVDRIAAEVVVIGDAGSVLRLGVYAHDLATNRPRTLLLDAGTIPGDAIATSAITINLALSRGMVWLGAAIQRVTVTQPTVRISTQQYQAVTSPTPSVLMTTAAGWIQTGVTGALPNPFVPGSNPGSVPRMTLRRAA